ncbi:P-loop containing nucleoside triphosphate hydrolase protein [Pseudohyphozyma bogoriensis]|nr:P-loop containing nucleoside triphosphate hydrolase protein [Pseudohyphozyma bogoriensis]
MRGLTPLAVARRALLAAACSYRRPPASKRARLPLLSVQEPVHSGEARAYETLHNAELDKLGLRSGSRKGTATLKRDLLTLYRQRSEEERGELREVVLAMQDGRLTDVNEPREVMEWLKLGGGKVMEQLVEDVRTSLELRWMEAKAEGRLLDPSRRALKFALSLLPLSSTKPPSLYISTAHPSSNPAPTTPPPSAQHALILASPTSPGLSRIKALAGCGKTTSILQLAAKHSKEGKRNLYVCFNVEAAASAREKMGRTAMVKTSGAMAFALLKKRFGREKVEEKLLEGAREVEDEVEEDEDEVGHDTRPTRDLKVVDIVEILELPEETTFLKGKGKRQREVVVSDMELGYLVLQTLERFWWSPSTDVSPSLTHLPPPKPKTQFIPTEEVVELSNRLWNRIRDFDDVEVPLPQSCFAKLLLQEGIRIRDYGAFENIYYDEAQDSSDAELDWVMQETDVSRVVWRGGNNTWLTLDADTELELTQSFRSGSAICNVANALLTAKGEEEKLVGTGRPAKVFRPIAKEDRVTLLRGKEAWTGLFATNIRLVNTLFNTALPLLDTLPGPTSPNSRLELALRINKSRQSSFPNFYHHAHALYHDLPIPPEHTHPLLEAFDDWESLVQGVRDLRRIKEEHTRELRNVVREVRWLEFEGFKEVLEVAEGLVKEKAERVLGVVFQVKGDESDNVFLSNDFPKCFKGRAKGLSDPAWEERVNTLYVAATRAKEKLVMNDELLKFGVLERGIHHFRPVSATSSKGESACARCSESTATLIDYVTPFPHFNVASLSTDPASPLPLSPSGTDASARGSVKDDEWARFEASVEVEEGERGGEGKGVSFAEFEERWAENVNMETEVVEAEIGIRSFWDDGEGEERGASDGEEEDD